MDEFVVNDYHGANDITPAARLEPERLTEQDWRAIDDWFTSVGELLPGTGTQWVQIEHDELVALKKMWARLDYRDPE